MAGTALPPSTDGAALLGAPSPHTLLPGAPSSTAPGRGGCAVNERFIRCAHCGMPHEASREACPATGKPIERVSARQMPGSAADSRRPVDASRRPAAGGPVASTGTTPAAPLPRRDLIGKTIGGKYNVRAVLGEGGMGTVFEALNLSIGRQVAIKVLHANQLRKKDAVRRFHQEARSAGAIGHPNICEVYDLGTLDDGCPYLVMEKLVGETLADRIASEGGLPVDEVIDVLTQVLSGLVAAHEKGIVHRDIKPENVFLTRRVGCAPVAKLLDFGVSKMISVQPADRDGESETELTRTGIVLGTPYYLAPEQARGDRHLDERVDLYACGVLTYEALTGRRPFTAQNYNALLINILTGTPRPIRDLRPGLPRGFERVLDKAMARDPGDRYQSAVEFQIDLRRLSTRVSGTSMPMSARVPEAAPLSSRIRDDLRFIDERAQALRPEARAFRTTRRGAAERRAAVPHDFTVPPSRPPPPPTSKAPLPPPLPPPRAMSLPKAPPRPFARRNVAHGFDDLPTEVQPPGGIPDFAHVDDEETALMDDGDVKRITGAGKRFRSEPEFVEDSKTDVMNADLRAQLAKASEKPRGPRR